MELELNQFGQLCEGINAYYTFIYNIIFNYDKPNIKLSKKQILNAKVAFIETIMQYAEDNMIDKKKRETGNKCDYETKIIDEVFYKAVDLLFDKNSDGKYINNGHEIIDIKFIIHMVRDKFSHAQYVLDEEKEEVTININNNLYIFPLNRLENYCKLAINSFNFQKTNILKRSVSYLSKDVIVNLHNKNDVDYCINKITEENYELLSPDNREFTFAEINEFNNFIDAYTNHNKKPNKELFGLKQKEYAKRGFVLSKTRHKLLDEKVKNNIKEIFYNNIYAPYETNESLMNMLVSLVHKCLNKKLEQFNVCELAINNLYILDVMEKKNIFDINEIIKYTECNMLNINEDFITCLVITMFNIFFNYAYEKYLFKKEINNEDILFDFNLLDTSKFNILIEKNNEYQLKAERKNMQNIEDLKKKEADSSTSPKRIEKIARQIQALRQAINHYNLVKEKINNYYNKNFYIICGIRNAIDHGHYRLISNKSIADSIIEFTDIYEGEETFKCQIPLADFTSFINDGFTIISNYIMDKTNNLKR